MKVALVYDRINKWGGAEQVLLALHEIWPKAPLYTSVFDKKATPWADVFKVRTSFLQQLPLPKNKHEYYPFLMGLAFESFSFDEFDVVISITSEFCKAIITKPKTLHLCYCLTPTSYLWSGFENYFNSQILKFLSQPMIKFLRCYDKIVCHRPDKYLAISKTVQERIKRYYSQNSDLIYPPVNLGIQSNETGDFFLVVSRLVPNKKIDVAITAFNKLRLPLKIVGVGREMQNLKKIAKKNIEFLGHLTDQQLAKYYQSCLAVVVPGEEDFGIVAVGAQSFGKPVIAYGHGGATETVIEGKTGYFFDKDLAKTISSVKLSAIDAKDCIANAQKFSKERFKQAFLNYVEKQFLRLR